MKFFRSKMEDVMVLCKKCGAKAPSSSMKLDIDERLVICQECVKGKNVQKEVQQKAALKKEIPILENPEQEKSSKVGHKCSACGFKFRVDVENKKPKNCPYCNARIIFNYI